MSRVSCGRSGEKPKVLAGRLQPFCKHEAIRHGEAITQLVLQRPYLFIFKKGSFIFGFGIRVFAHMYIMHTTYVQ